MRLVDGPDEVRRNAIAKIELAKRAAVRKSLMLCRGRGARPVKRVPASSSQRLFDAFAVCPRQVAVLHLQRTHALGAFVQAWPFAKMLPGNQPSSAADRSGRPWDSLSGVCPGQSQASTRVQSPAWVGKVHLV